ncbi:MAG: hypothetical protein K5894_10360 [Lachnospiraceae bacterium]|nr:hypothetical protein [Lachnospiraceae bacterium]
MNIKDIEKHIKRGIGNLVPDLKDKIWETPVEKADKDAWFLKNSAQKKFFKINSISTYVAAAAAVFFICILSLYNFSFKKDATVYLDVNPSIELAVSASDKIISAEADNKDGEQVLDEMELKGVPLDVAMNAIVGSMYKHGYIGKENDIMLISVESGSKKKADKIKETLTEDAAETLANIDDSHEILNQTVKVDKDTVELAKKYDISNGKAALAQKIAADNENITAEELASVSLSDMMVILEDNEVDIKDYTGYKSSKPLKDPALDLVSEDKVTPSSDTVSAQPVSWDDIPEEATEEVKEEAPVKESPKPAAPVTDNTTQNNENEAVVLPVLPITPITDTTVENTPVVENNDSDDGDDDDDDDEKDDDDDDDDEKDDKHGDDDDDDDDDD